MDYDPSINALIHPEHRIFLGPGQPWNDAAVLAECARLAYLRFENGGREEYALRSALKFFKYNDLRPFFNTGRQFGQHRFDTQAYGAVSSARTALVVFRGTQSDAPADVLADASFLPAEWVGDGKVHNGFWGSLQDALPKIQDWIERVNPQRLIITGHSLGAAQATLLAGIYKHSELVTFGSPLIGDLQFAASFIGQKVTRFVDCLDIVTHVPPLIYHHLDGLAYIDRLGVVQPNGFNFLHDLGEKLQANVAYSRCIRPDNCPLRSLADHAPINYVSALLGVRTGP